MVAGGHWWVTSSENDTPHVVEVRHGEVFTVRGGLHREVFRFLSKIEPPEEKPKGCNGVNHDFIFWSAELDSGSNLFKVIVKCKKCGKEVWYHNYDKTDTPFYARIGRSAVEVLSDRADVDETKYETSEGSELPEKVAKKPSERIIESAKAEKRKQMNFSDGSIFIIQQILNYLDECASEKHGNEVSKQAGFK